MTELNAASNRMVLIIDCKVKDIEQFKTWSKDRAAKYVYELKEENSCLLYTSPSPRDAHESRMPSSA